MLLLARPVLGTMTQGNPKKRLSLGGVCILNELVLLVRVLRALQIAPLARALSGYKTLMLIRRKRCFSQISFI